MPSSILDELIASGFSQLSGLRISGTVPVQQDLANEALAELLEKWRNPQPAEPSKRSAAHLLKLVRKLQVRAETGVINLDFEIGV